MDILPPFRAERFNKTEPGELCVMEHDNGRCAALVVVDPMRNNEKLIAPLGPIFPGKLKYPTVISTQAMTVIKFGKEFDLRFSTEPDGWSIDVPKAEVPSIMLADDRPYLRVSFVTGEFKACYVAFDTGEIVCDKTRGFIEPAGIKAFAVKWAFVTKEKPPRILFQYPA